MSLPNRINWYKNKLFLSLKLRDFLVEFKDDSLVNETRICRKDITKESLSGTGYTALFCNSLAEKMIIFAARRCSALIMTREPYSI